MPQTVARCSQRTDRPIEFIRARDESLPVDLRLTVRPEHRRDLVERKTAGLAERDQREPLQYARREPPAQSASAARRDQSFLFVEPQRRCGYAGLLHDFGNVQMSHALDLKSA